LNIYADASFLISLYSADTNSIAAARTMRLSRGACFVSRLGELEVINALGLKVFRRDALSAEAESSLADFQRDLRDGVLQLRPLPESAFDRARQLSWQTTARLGTRTADLLHVAAALELGAGYLYSFDKQQRKLAQVLHLKLN
jgi:predicted nucleic acid-binding protein